MTVRTWAMATSCVGSLAFASACSTNAVGLEDEESYVETVRAEILSAKNYDAGELVKAGEQVCYIGAVPDGAKLIAREYEEIAARDRERLAYFALTVGCPNGGTG